MVMAVLVGVGGLGGHFDVFVGGVFNVRWVVAGCLVVVLVVGSEQVESNHWT